MHAPLMLLTFWMGAPVALGQAPAEPASLGTLVESLADEPPPVDTTPGPPRLARLTFYWENDGAYVKRFDASDGHYTNGLEIEACFTAPLIPGVGPWLDSWLPLGDAPTHAGALSITQLIFTPDDIENPDLIEDDRPYAGYLALTLAHQRRAGNVFDHTSLDVGIVGEWSGAEGLQKAIHAAVPNEPRPEGWSNQLTNELGINLAHQRRWRSRQVPLAAWLHADAIPQVGFRLGNVWTDATVGATVRLGYHLPDDFGPPRISEFLDATAPSPEDRLSLYCFARLTGSAVARNIFLDGNTFADSHSVDSKPFIGDVTLGLVARYRALSLIYSITWETETFEGQEGVDSYGTLALSWNMDF